MRKIEWLARGQFLWMVHRGNAREKKYNNLVSLSLEGREKHPLSEALQHRIFRPFDLPSHVNRMLRFAARVIDERMKPRCLHRYLRPLRFFLNISLLPRSRDRLSIECLQLCFNLPAIAVTVLITHQDLLSIAVWHGERVDSAIVTRWKLYLTSGCTAVEYRSSWTKIWQFSDITFNDNSCPINTLANFNWILHSL